MILIISSVFYSRSDTPDPNISNCDQVLNRKISIIWKHVLVSHIDKKFCSFMLMQPDKQAQQVVHICVKPQKTFLLMCETNIKFQMLFFLMFNTRSQFYVSGLEESDHSKTHYFNCGTNSLTWKINSQNL